jgi:hypothetical protein
LLLVDEAGDELAAGYIGGPASGRRPPRLDEQWTRVRGRYSAVQITDAFSHFNERTSFSYLC